MVRVIFGLALFLSQKALAQSPFLLDEQGRFLGNLNQNPFDLYSTSNPYGPYGSEYHLTSINNPNGIYGSAYFPSGATSTTFIGGGPRIFSPDGQYLGRLNQNETELDSADNPVGPYGNEFSLVSIKNPFGPYGGETFPSSATFANGVSLTPSKSAARYYPKPTGEQMLFNNLIRAGSDGFANYMLALKDQQKAYEWEKEYSLKEKELDEERRRFDLELGAKERELKNAEEKTQKEVTRMDTEIQELEIADQQKVVAYQFRKEIRQIANESCKAVDYLVDRSEDAKARAYKTPPSVFEIFPQKERMFIKQEVEKIVEDYKNLSL
jgi:hypothetical protein